MKDKYGNVIVPYLRIDLCVDSEHGEHTMDTVEADQMDDYGQPPETPYRSHLRGEKGL